MSELPDTIAVLHVDDEPDFSELTAELLERQDDRFRIQTATNVSEGLDRLVDEDVDCIVSDYQMPGMDGIEFLEAVRDEYPDLPFILFTGKGGEEVASEAIATGVTDYLQKGSGSERFELLSNRILNAVEQYRANVQATELDRIRTLVRAINQALVRASDRAEIETRVCEIISDTDPYLFAWIGEHDPETGTVEARTGAGVEDGYLDAIEITIDDRATGHGPTGTAVRTGELAVMQNIVEDDRYEPWREEAIERGYRSSAAIPLVFDETLFGVLNVYADRPGAFDDQEQDLLIELGDDIAHAMHTLEVQAALQEQVAWLQALFDESPDMIDVHDAEGTILGANPMLTEKVGYSREELIGKPIWELDESIEPDAARSALADMDVGDSLEAEGRFRLKDGSSFPVEVHVRRLDVAEGEHYLVISHDISEQKERERALREQTERLEEFAAVISHDLRNPLSTASGYLELVREERDSDHLAHVARNLDRMERIIDDVLWLAREGRDIGATEPTDLRAIVQESWTVVAGPENPATLELSDSQLGTIEADDDRLRQLVENLLSNALEHGDPDVTVRVDRLPNGFAIADDGPGIPAPDRERIFDVEYTTSDSDRGFGLHIVQEIAGAHGWDVRVQESYSGGAKFEIVGVAFIED